MKTIEKNAVRRSVAAIREQLQLSQEEAAGLIGTTATTLSRWANYRTPEPHTIYQERIQRIMALLAEAREVINPEGLAWWFKTEHPQLSDLRPIDLLRSVSGVDRVRTLLASMRWGLPA
jgi:uncharacterized protein (DUF2384 family)